METILIIGEWYSDNLGDGVLCETVFSLLEKRCTNTNLIKFDISLKKGYYKGENPKHHLYIHIIRWIGSKYAVFIRNISFCMNKMNEKRYEAYEQSLTETINKFQPKAIIFAGGQMLKDTFVNRIEKTVKISEERSLPIFFNACGCGNKMSKSLLNRLCRILESDNISMISVRDGFDTLSKKLNRKIDDTIDTAILLDDLYQFFEKKATTGFGIMLLSTKSLFKQIRFWKRIIKESLKRNIDFQLFCNGARSDYAFAKYIIKINRLDEEKYLAPRPKNPQDLVDLVTGYKTIVSMRLHSLIIAYSSNVPAIAIVWDEKVREFYRKVENTKYCMEYSSSASDLLNALSLIQTEENLFRKSEMVKKTASDNIAKLCVNINELV